MDKKTDPYPDTPACAIAVLGSPVTGERQTSRSPERRARWGSAPARDLPWAASGPLLEDDPPAGPDLAPWKERIVHGFAVVFLLYAVYYLVWRWTATLNPDALWFSVALAAAETTTLVSTFFFAFNVWSPIRRRVPHAPPGLSVDVYVTTYDEPIEVIRKTAAGAAAIRYPHRTWLLDDGRRDEVRNLAEHLGIGYITREGNEHAKAGNLNNALRHTDGEFILQLDADHVPLPSMLDRLLGYFRDPRLAFVQSPQSFYNTDSFTCRFDADRRRLFTEQSIFFRVIQPGKDRWNATFFCGSCAVVRRAALDELGGFSTDTVTEDFETSLRLHAAGWRSAYHAETLAYGLAPTTAAGFHTQRLRWAQGTMQVWRRYNPLTLRGLSLPQRICYFYSILVYLDGLPRIVFNLAPLVYLGLGVLPIAALGPAFILRFVPIFFGSILFNALLGRGTAQPFWLLERSNMTKAFTHSIGLLGYFSRHLRFKVTPKGRSRTPRALFAPHLALMVIAVAAVVWGTVALKMSWIDYGEGLTSRIGFLVNVGWAAWNFVIAWAVVRTSIAASEERGDYRFPDELPATFSRVSSPWQGAGRRAGVVVDLNASGMTLVSARPLAWQSVWAFDLPLAGGPLHVTGRVVRREVQRQDGQRVFRHGIAFAPLSVHEASRIDLHCTHDAVVFERAQMTEIEDVFDLVRPVLVPDGEPVALSAELTGGTEGRPKAPVPTVLRRRSPYALEFVSLEAVEPGSPVSFRVPDTNISGQGRIASSREIKTSLGSRHVLVMALTPGRPARRIRPVTPMMKKVAAMIILSLTGFKRLWVLVPLLATVLTTSKLAAQSPVSGGAVFSGERTQEDNSFLMAGAWLTLARTGWSPTASLIGYRLTYPATNGDFRILAGINPAVGLRRAWSAGDVQGSVGYAWQIHDQAEVQVVPGLNRVTSGVTTALQGQYWGDGRRIFQALTSYSWGGDGYFWSRVRGAQAVASPGDALVRLGVEASVEGNDQIRAWGAGPAVDLARSRQVVTLAGGLRHIEPNGGPSRSVWQVRLDVVLLR